jgi:hypothetical protein
VKMPFTAMLMRPHHDEVGDVEHWRVTKAGNNSMILSVTGMASLRTTHMLNRPSRCQIGLRPIPVIDCHVQQHSSVPQLRHCLLHAGRHTLEAPRPAGLLEARPLWRVIKHQKYIVGFPF